MNPDDQKTDNNDRKMEELRRLLRRLDRTDPGSPVAIVAASASNDDRPAGLRALPQQPPPLPPLPPLPPRQPSDSTTFEPKTPVSESKNRGLGPRLAAVGVIAATAVVGLILSIDLPRPGAPTTSPPGEGEVKAREDASLGPITTASLVPAAEKPASAEQTVPSFAPPSADVASANPRTPPPMPEASEPAPSAAAEPSPEPVEVEHRTAALDSASSPLPANSSSSSAPVLAIPPSFMVEEGVTSPFPLRLARGAGPFNGGYVIVSGLLRGSRFSSGTEIVFDTWQIPVDALGDLKLTIPSDGEAELAIELRSAQGQTVARTTTVVQAVKPASTSQRR
jgi:hypothetical protein